MVSKIRVRLSNAEVECEAEEAFIASNVLPIIERLFASPPKSAMTSPCEKVQPNGLAAPDAQGIGTLSTLAAKLKPASGPDLILAAFYHLAKVDGRETATRQDVLDRMKTAAAYYKASYRSNLTNYLDALIKANRLREITANIYALAAETIAELEAQLAHV